jgi:hypothetical protein
MLGGNSIPERSAQRILQPTCKIPKANMVKSVPI